MWRQGVKRLCTAALPSGLWLAKGPAARGEIALTFDDGPDPDTTPRVLDVLAEHGAVATFFVVGVAAAKYPDLVRRIAAEGHALGHHSFFHNEPSRTSADELRAEVHQTREVLNRITGQTSNLFRPPKGQLTWTKMLGLWRQRQTIVLWNVDPRDYAMTSDAQAREWVDGHAPASGDLVLLHDNRPHTPVLTDALLSRISAARLTTVPITGWLPSRAVPRARPDAARRPR